jgi:periplasmic divalent cation tolerance protein
MGLFFRRRAMEYVIAFVTTGGMEEAKKIAAALVERKLAAGVNIIPEVLSYYWWEGEVESEVETKLVIKTKPRLMAAVIRAVKELHSYEVCEVTFVPIVGGNADYLKWIDGSVLLT